MTDENPVRLGYSLLESSRLAFERMQAAEDFGAPGDEPDTVYVLEGAEGSIDVILGAFDSVAGAKSGARKHNESRRGFLGWLAIEDWQSTPDDSLYWWAGVYFITPLQVIREADA